MKSRPVSVNVTANGLAANQAQQTANQAQASAIKYKTAWEEANAENLAALSTAQSEFKSNLAWVKSQIHEGKHQNDSAVASLQSDMESSWDSMSTVEQSLYNSASTATSEVDSHLESLRAQNSQSLADLHNTANSLHAAATSLHADANAMRSSLTAATSELGKDITTTRNSLDGVRNSLRTASSELGDNLAGARNSLAAVDSSLRTATSEVGNNLNSVKNSLAAVDADLRNGIKQANNDLSAAKTSLTATGNSLANRAGSLATATSELQRQTGQLSGSLSTADSMIMFNSNAIAEVKRTAGEISTTVSNIRVGGRNLLTNTRTLSDVWNGTTETVDGFAVAKATNTRTDGGNYDIIAWNGLTNIKSNTDYVLTFYAKASKTTGIYSYLYNIGPGDRYMDGSTRNALTTDYQRYTVHFHTATMPAGRTVNCLPVRLIEGGVTAWVYGVQLEEGNIATQWQPNPADTDQAISKVSQTADAIRADLTNTKGDVASVKATANSLQSQITDNKNNISSVKQTAQGLQTQVSDNKKNITAVAQTAQGLATRVSNAEGNVSGLQQTAKSLQSSVSDNAKNISSVKQTADSLTTRMTNAEGDVSSLQQTAKGLESTVANMDVGGRNLFAGDTGKEYSKTGTTSNQDIANFRMLIPADQEHYVLSFDAKATTAGQQITTFLYCRDNYSKNCILSAITSSGFNGAVNGDGHVTTKLTTEYKRYWIKYTINPANKVYLNGIIARIEANSGTATVSVKNAKLETGTMPTDWTPSPESIDVSFSQINQTISGITARVQNTEGDVSGLQQTAKSIQTSVSDNAKNISNVKQTATTLQSDLSNAKGDISSLKQTASGLTSRVGNAEGSISQLQQTANGLTSTVSNMKSGGANMLPAGKLISYYSSTVTYDVGTDTYTIVNPVTANASWGSGVALPGKVIEVPWGQTACISMQVYTPTAGEMAVDINNGAAGVTHGNDNDNRNKSALHNSNIPANEWTTFWFTYENSSVSGNPKKASLWDAHTGIGLKLNNVTWKIRHPMVQIGTFPSEWSPSPKDTDSAISQIKQTADRIQAQVNDNKGNISSVTQTANTVKTDLANTKGDVASVKAKADSLTTLLADAKGNISQLQQTATGLQSTVQSQSGKISQLQQDADGLSTTVGGAAIDVIPNLDKQFVMGYGIANTTWQDGNSYIKLPTTKKKHEVLPQTAGFALTIPWQAGKTYIQSIIFETDATINEDGHQPQWSWFTNDHDWRKATLTKLGDNTYRLIGAYTPTQAKVNSGYLRIFDIANFTNFVDVTTGTYLKFRNPRIWCPDDNSLAQLKLTADGLTSKVADTQGNVSKLQQTASSLQTQITNTKGDVSSLQVKADGIRTDLTNAKGDIANVKSKADSLTSSMTNANNQIGTLQQRANSLTSTLSQGGTNLLNNSQGNFQPKHSTIDNYQVFDDVSVYMTEGRKYTVSAQSAAGFAFSGSHVTTAESNRITLWLVDPPKNIWQVISSDTTDISKGGTHFTWNHASGTYSLRVNSYRKDNSGYAYHVKIEYGDTATPWKPSNGDISSLQQTASQLTSDMKDAKGNISSLQQTAGTITTRLQGVDGSISSLQQKSNELTSQIRSVDGKASTIQQTADGIGARVSKIEGNKVVGSMLKLDGNETGLGTYVNNKLIAGINTNPDGVCIEGKNIHLNGQTHIDDGVINASKITVYNTVGDNKGNQYLSVAWGQLNSTIGGKDDRGNTLWGSINQTKDKFSSYYTRSDIDGKLSQQSSLISQTADNITAIVNDAKNFTTYTVSSSSPWNFDFTKSIYGNWFLNGETNANHVYNGPQYTNGQKLSPYMYVTSRGPKDGSRFVVTVWKDNDPTQYQRTWSENKWSDWVMLPNSQNLISAINLSPDSVKINGKNIELNGNTKVTGRLDLMQDSARSVSQSTNYHNNWVWNNAHIYFDNYLQLLGENCNVHYTNTNTTLNGGKTFYSITTLTPGYLKFTTYDHKVNETDENFDGQITRSYLDSGRLETPEVYTDKFVITGHHIRVRDNQFLMLTNKNGTNFDNYGNVGFQIYGGIALGKQTIGSPTRDIYFQQGNIDGVINQDYSRAPKVLLHCDHVASQSANTVTSRLSTKTAITKVDYDRALMAVQNTDMYDYRYIADNAGQHYVSGIIDDVHDKPEYNMDPMLINQERTARIDANLLGYHHVVLQEILKRLDKLEAK